MVPRVAHTVTARRSSSRTVRATAPARRRLSIMAMSTTQQAPHRVQAADGASLSGVSRRVAQRPETGAHLMKISPLLGSPPVVVDYPARRLAGGQSILGPDAWGGVQACELARSFLWETRAVLAQSSDGGGKGGSCYLIVSHTRGGNSWAKE